MKLLPISFAFLMTVSVLSTYGANIIVNGSFEDTNIIQGSNNNLGVVVPDWTITDSTNSDPNPTNLVSPSAGYAGGPDAAQDGVVYFDGNGTDVRLFQDFNITVDQTVTYSAYFSRRDSLSALGNNVKIYNSAGTVLLGSSSVVDIPNNVSQELWFQSTGSLFLAAGDYQLRVDLQNDANIDNVVLNAIPEPSSIMLISLSGVAGVLYLRRRAVRR